MQYQFYIDRFLLLEFGQNFWLLSLLCYLSLEQRKHLVVKQCLLAAFLAGSALFPWIFSWIFPWKILWSIPWKILLSILWILSSVLMVAFVGWKQRDNKRTESFWKLYVRFWMLALFYGGCNLVGIQWMVLCTGKQPGILVRLGWQGIVAFLMKKAISWYRGQRERNIFPVEMCIGEKRIQLKGLLDTGNSLKDPLTGQPVCLLSSVVFDNFFTKTFAEEYPERFRMIPFHSVGEERGLAVGYLVDQMQIKRKGSMVRMKKMIVARAPGNVALSNRYEVILHRCFETEGEKEE